MKIQWIVCALVVNGCGAGASESESTAKSPVSKKTEKSENSLPKIESFCEQLDFSIYPDSSSVLPGAVVSNQWEGLGVVFSVQNPNFRPIVFSSTDPTGEDEDLQTPGPNNEEDLGNIVIVAENLVDEDRDGRVDVPDDNAKGGVIVLTFSRPTLARSIKLVDIEEAGTFLRLNKGDESFDVPVEPEGNNSVQRMLLPEIGLIKSLEIHFDGSGAMDEFNYCQ